MTRYVTPLDQLSKPVERRELIRERLLASERNVPVGNARWAQLHLEQADEFEAAALRAGPQAGPLFALLATRYRAEADRLNSKATTTGETTPPPTPTPEDEEIFDDYERSPV